MDEDYPIELLEKEARERDEAEAAGVFNDEHPANKFTDDQIMALHFAMSQIAQIARETDSSLSDLVAFSGFNLR